MPQIIIADTSCLILLHKINELVLLRNVFGQITITDTIANEYSESLPEWIEVRVPEDNFWTTLTAFLDAGEASAIALALEVPSSLLIVDELKGRKVAKELGINYTGTLGVIGSAKVTGKIQAVKPLIDKIRNTDFRVSEALLKRVLELDNE